MVKSTSRMPCAPVIMFLSALASFGAGSARAVPPGFDTATITFPDGFRGAAALAYGIDGTLYVAEGKDFLEATNLSTIYAVGRDGAVLDTILLEGDDTAGGGNISIGGMAYHPLRDELLITDNAPGAGTLYSVSPSMKSMTSHRSFVELAQIDDVAVRATGEVVVTNASLVGEVHQIDLESSRVTRLATQLETAAGVAFESNGDLIYQQSVITSFDPFQSHGEVFRMELDDAGTELAVTSTTKLADDLTATFDVTTDGDGGIFVSGAGGLFELVENPAGTPPLLETVFDPQGFATEVAFHGGGRPFEPFGGPDAGVLAFIPSFNSPTVTLVTPSVPQLQAGDANQDLRFDQFDLVAVQQAGEYLTGQPATWGEGDWNGAPGGNPGSPPVGDGIFDQRDIVSALEAAAYLTGPYAAAKPPADESDSRATLTYDARSGEVRVDDDPGGPLTTINVESADSIFYDPLSAHGQGIVELADDGRIMTGTLEESFRSIRIVNVGELELSKSFSPDDPRAAAFVADGPADDVQLVYVPEPMSAVPFVCGLVAILIFKRTKHLDARISR